MICCRRLTSVTMVSGSGARGVDVEVHVLGLGDVAEAALDRALQVVQPQLADLHRDRARLDLRQVQDVVDQHQQVVAREVDGLRELHLPRRQVAVAVLAQLVRQDQQAVERRAQLVRHVGQELGLVLGGERELLGLLLQRLAGLLHLLVLALHLLVLVHQQAGLLLQLLVGLLQFLLAALQLLGQRLRLRQQVLGAHVGRDGVDHDADGFGQLVQEGLVRGVEALERGQLQHAAHLALEDHRQHDHVHAPRLRSGRWRCGRSCSARWSAGSSDFSTAHWPTRPWPSSISLPCAVWPPEA